VNVSLFRTKIKPENLHKMQAYDNKGDQHFLSLHFARFAALHLRESGLQTADVLQTPEREW
jgi:hypothetical protein